MHAPMLSESPHRASGSYKRSARADDNPGGGISHRLGPTGLGRVPSGRNWGSNEWRPGGWVHTSSKKFKPLAVRDDVPAWITPRTRAQRSPATSGARYGGRRSSRVASSPAALG